jgi:hypothetical protein
MSLEIRRYRQQLRKYLRPEQYQSLRLSYANGSCIAMLERVLLASTLTTCALHQVISYPG